MDINMLDAKEKKKLKKK